MNSVSDYCDKKTFVNNKGKGGTIIDIPRTIHVSFDFRNGFPLSIIASFANLRKNDHPPSPLFLFRTEEGKST